MIDVQVLYSRVELDLARKGIGGFSSNNQFNRSMKEAEIILFEYWAEKFSEDQDVVDALLPFIASYESQIVSGRASYPSDYRRMLSVDHKNVVNTTGEPVVNFTKVRKIAENEDRRAYRKPVVGNDKTYVYAFYSDHVRISPNDLTGYVEFRYLRVPVYGNRVVTVNTSTDDQDYNSVSSRQLEWPEHQFSNIVDIMLLAKGAEIQRTELLQFAQVRMQKAESK